MKLTAQAPPETSSGTFKTLEGLISNFSRYSNSDAITTFGADGKRQTPYKKLSNLVEQLSNALLNKGIERGEPILLISPNSPEMIVAALSVINSGGVAVPVDLR
jgi:acyl-CoA synthetase (AMP-forming)/AMP-acid ligase II